MKRRIALLSAVALLSLMFPVTAYADVIEGPSLSAIAAEGAAPIIIIILVAVLATATVLIIRRLKKSGKGQSPFAGKNADSAQDTQDPPKH